VQPGRQTAASRSRCAPCWVADAVHLWRAFSLTFACDRPLSGLPSAEGPPDVVIRTEELRSGMKLPPGDPPSDIMLHWVQFGSAHIRDGREITLYPLPGVDEWLLRHVLTGPVMGAVLNQRACLTLHASTVSIDGGGVAFVGEKGRGKSTTAATLVARGHPLVTDDILALSFGPTITVVPGIPVMKLWDDSVRAGLSEEPATLPVFQAGYAKRMRWLKSDAGGPIPLSVIYVLDFADDVAASIRIEACTPQQAFHYLALHEYTRSTLGGRLMFPPDLGRAARLVREVPVRRLLRPRSLDALPELAARIEADAATARRSEPPLA
jgi:hypothetical protein